MGGFQPLEERATWTERALWAVMVCSLAVGVHAIVDAAVLGRAVEERGSVSASRLALSDTLSAVLVGLLVVASISATVAFLMWVHRAAQNLAALGERSRRYSPGWSVGSWFVPFVNLVVPKRVMNDLWRAGRPRDDYPWWMNLWWAAWLLSFPFTNLGGRGFNETNDLGELQGQDHVDIVLSAVYLTSGLLAVAVVRSITRRQREVADADPPAPPPPPAPVHAASVPVGPEHPAAAAAVAAPQPYEAPARWRPLATLSRWTIAVLGLCLIWAAFAAAADLYGIDVVEESIKGDESRLDSSDTLDLISGISGTVVGITAFVLFLVWLARAVSNVRVLDGRAPRHGSGWVVGSFFVPAAGFVVGLQAVLDLDRVGHPVRKRPLLVVVWWVVGWIAVLTALVLLVLYPGEGADLEDYPPAYRREIVALPVEALATVLTILVVRSITRRLEARARAVGLPQD